MILKYNENEVRMLILDFYNATGVNLNILDNNFKKLVGSSICPNSYCGLIQSCPKRKNLCDESDIRILKRCEESKTAQMHMCHFGLIDIAVPIIYKNLIIGYIILGQLKNEDDFSVIREQLPIDEKQLDNLEKYYHLLPYYDDKKIKSILNVAVILAKHLLTENIINPDPELRIKNILEYIDNNLHKKISIDELSKTTNISKSSMYKLFHEHTGGTIKDYINSRRVEIATDLLMNSDLSIDEIAFNTGFSSSSYFSKFFKKLYGESPLKYRNQQKKYK